MQVISSIPDFRKARSDLRGTLGLVPTMGYLHEGHLALVRRARLENDAVAASIFVNPSQFGPNEDFTTYPRDMDRDLSLLRVEGVDLVFAPSPEDVYPPGFDTWIEAGSVSQRLEGEHRPGHFRGVATVVAKLFNVVQPDRAYFGQKDGQQVAVVKRMVTDLDMDVDVVVVSTLRDPDGLALSSRNVYLTPEQRRVAPIIYRALCQARKLWEDGERSGESLRSEIRRTLEQEPLIEKIDYVSVADASSLEEVDTIRQPAMVSVAARMGRTRLIDNVLLG
ncbi:MAG: pantoate--beta-alanine ligase [Dehalococcoidia bacterium]|nr:pantoate--beta-alanine ligase [Dehalococcoidia bacterium]